MKSNKKPHKILFRLFSRIRPYVWRLGAHPWEVFCFFLKAVVVPKGIRQEEHCTNLQFCLGRIDALKTGKDIKSFLVKSLMDRPSLRNWWLKSRIESLFPSGWKTRNFCHLIYFMCFWIYYITVCVCLFLRIRTLPGLFWSAFCNLLN